MAVSPHSEFYGTSLLISFVADLDDRDATVAMLKGLNLKTLLLWEDEDYRNRLDIWVRSVEDAMMVKTAVGEDLRSEGWHLACADADFTMGAVYDHRADGPAFIDYTASPRLRESYRLWDRVLPAKYAFDEAVAAGVADDPDAFLDWVKARLRPHGRGVTLQRGSGE